MHLRLLTRFILLTLGFALTTAGILGWQTMDFDLHEMWPHGERLLSHPVYIMVLGMALIPPTLWEIFILEVKRTEDAED
ncbi:MAG: hypothetical protein AAF993_12495 [Pseudomonadota bacterium]